MYKLGFKAGTLREAGWLLSFYYEEAARLRCTHHRADVLPFSFNSRGMGLVTGSCDLAH
jgi:hypothetical protein